VSFLCEKWGNFFEGAVATEEITLLSTGKQFTLSTVHDKRMDSFDVLRGKGDSAKSGCHYNGGEGKDAGPIPFSGRIKILS